MTTDFSFGMFVGLLLAGVAGVLGYLIGNFIAFFRRKG